MTLAKSCEPLGKPGQPKWTDPEVHRLVNPNQGLPGSRWKNAQFRIRPDLWWPVLWWFFATLVILVVILRRSWLYPSGFPNQRVPSGQARFPDPLRKASGSGNLSTSGHPDPGRNAAHYRVSTNLCQQSHTKLMPSGHSFHNFKYPFFLTTVWIKIIVLSRSILITIQLFPNSAKDLEVRLNFEQATYCLRDWGASPYMTNNLL